mgnify:CR=1 FL=1
MEGIKSVISLGQQTLYSTPVTPTVSIPVLPSDGIQVVQDVVDVEGIRGSAPKARAFSRGKRMFEGGFELPLYPNSIGYLLKSIFGDVSPATVEAGAVYKHTFTEAIQKCFLTIEQSLAGAMTKRYSAYIVGNLKISGKVGELITVSFSGKAKTEADATAITASFETPRAFNFKDVDELSIGGTDVKAKVQDFEIEYEIGLEVFHGLGDYEPSVAYVKQSEAKGKMTLYLDSATKSYYEDVLAGTEREIILDIIGDVIGSASANELKVTLPKCSIDKTDTKLDFDYTAVALEFHGREDVTNGLIKAELTNTIAAY